MVNAKTDWDFYGEQDMWLYRSSAFRYKIFPPPSVDRVDAPSVSTQYIGKTAAFKGVVSIAVRNKRLPHFIGKPVHVATKAGAKSPLNHKFHI